VNLGILAFGLLGDGGVIPSLQDNPTAKFSQ
jgi:hypothetical protein